MGVSYLRWLIISILGFVHICGALPVAPDAQASIGRQDVGDGVEGVGELVEVGEQVGTIVNGVVSSNVGDIFKGTLPFIEDSDVQTGVGTIFDSLTKPLNMLWAAGNKQALKYFGITEATTRNPLLANTANNSTAVIPAAGTVIATTAA
ncbi:Bifunctional ribose 1,5-bisphosphokinase-thymidine phosphorylase, partial [Folsomia candida]